MNKIDSTKGDCFRGTLTSEVKRPIPGGQSEC